MHREPNWVASRTPGHGFTGIGSRQRKSPTGGVAKGMPLKTAPRSRRLPPRIFPPVTVTTGDSCAAAAMLRSKKAASLLMTAFALIGDTSLRVLERTDVVA